MSQVNEQYWLKRLLHDSAKVYNYAEGQLSKLRREYEKAIKQIDKELRTAKHTERLDKLKARLLAEIDRLMEYEEALTKDTLLQVYEEGFYRSAYNIQQALGYGTGAIFIGPQAAEIAVGVAWSGKNYSERIWQHRELLAKKVEQILTKGTILGQSNAQMAKQLAGSKSSQKARFWDSPTRRWLSNLPLKWIIHLPTLRGLCEQRQITSITKRARKVMMRWV
ncbi:hypothetical protein A0U40_18000 [[Bacillus] sp. KCTC 13219]|nr:hypothetical protein A0U40_18000 [[Bacillus] sp. KCTC 13219]